MDSVFGDLSDKFEIVQKRALGLNLAGLKSKISEYLHCDYYTLCSKVKELVKEYNDAQSKMNAFQRGTYRIVSINTVAENKTIVVQQDDVETAKILFLITPLSIK
jgi:hypothetical protein